MPLVEVTKLVRGPRAAVYAMASEMERFPEFMDDVVSIKILERDDNTTVTEWVTNLEGRRLQWTERDVFDDETYHIAYHQIEGDLKK
ncbi:MAG: SRPBCC family protein, partial [Thermaerobacterales bacterium]